MTFDFGVLVAHAARTRSLGPGTVIGSGTVSIDPMTAGRQRVRVTRPDVPLCGLGAKHYTCVVERRLNRC
jgi:fumarylacetoacetate (FAA) hydrolase